MARIFISYRRQDSPSMTGRIYDQLEAAFGSDRVFRDIDDIGAGQDFRAKIAQEIGQSDILLVIIGPKWESITDAQGRRRLENPNDFVRLEVEEGLKNPKKIVIPVLVENTPMPNAEALPKSLQELCYRNAINIRQDPDFHPDVQKLIHAIRKVTKSGAPVSKNTPTLIGAGVLGILILAGIVITAMFALRSAPGPVIPGVTSSPTGNLPLTATFTEAPPVAITETMSEAGAAPASNPVRIGVIQIPDTIYKDTVKRLDNLGFDAEWIDVSSDYSDFTYYDVIYLPAGWYAENRTIGSLADDYQQFVEEGGGLVVEQPDPKSAFMAQVLPYAMVFEPLPDSTRKKATTILNDHEIVQNLRDTELPGPGNWITPRDDHWLVVSTCTTTTNHKYVTLAVAEYGEGRIVVLGSGISKSSELKFQVGDHFIKRFIEWVSSFNVP